MSSLKDASGDTRNDNACAPVPAFAIDKTAPEGPAVLQPDGSRVVSYAISVTNTGSVAGNYDLDDTLQFDERIQVLGGTVTGPEGVPINPEWTGTGAESSRISTGIPLAADATHRYQVEVTFALDHSDPETFRSTLTCQEVAPGEGTGLKNATQLLYNSLVLSDTACPPPHEAPRVELNKTITAGPFVTAQLYEVGYTIEVKNVGSVDTFYDLVAISSSVMGSPWKLPRSRSSRTPLRRWTPGRVRANPGPIP